MSVEGVIAGPGGMDIFEGEFMLFLRTRQLLSSPLGKHGDAMSRGQPTREL